MLDAYEDGAALHLTARSDRGNLDLFTDTTGEALFAFADNDFSDLTKLLVQYLRSRIDIESLECLEPEEDLLPEIHDRLLALHPFFRTLDHLSAIPDMLAASMNQLMESKDVDEEKYYELLHHLTSPSLSLCLSDTQYLTGYHDDLLFRRRCYNEYKDREKITTRQLLRNRGITSLGALQKYVKLYLYWVLDASSARFKTLGMDERLALFARVFGSVNQWQPLAVKEVSCIGMPDGHSVYDIFLRGRWEMLNNADRAGEIADETMHRAEEEKERQSFAKVLAELVSDDPDLDAEMNSWMNSQIDAAKKETSQPLFKAYEISCFSDYILLQLRLMTEKAVVVKRCKNCGQYFITERTNIDYCQRIRPGETQTCFVIGPKRVFNKNLSTDIPRGLYSKAYKRCQLRFRRQSITEDEWTAWKAQAKKMLDDVQNGIISIEEYTQWIER